MIIPMTPTCWLWFGWIGNVDILLQDFYDDTELLKILPNVALQVIKGKKYGRFLGSRIVPIHILSPNMI